MNKLLAVLPFCLVVSACGGQQPPPFKAVVDTKTLMAALLEKQADIVWEAVGTTIEGDKIEEHHPMSEEEWTNVRNAAVAVAETGNLLMIAPRAQDEGWMTAAAGMIAQGERMLNAIDRRNTKDVFDVGSDLYDSCVNCHMHYMPAIKDLYK
jgi:hypothetical protein